MKFRISDLTNAEKEIFIFPYVIEQTGNSVKSPSFDLVSVESNTKFPLFDLVNSENNKFLLFI